MKIRKMSEKDVEEVARIEQQIFTSPWSRESLQRACKEEDNIYLVAERENKLIGYCGIWCSFESADLCNIAVLPGMRRQGVAEAILDEAVSLCRQRNVEQMLLEVRISNVAAISFYQKKGFFRINIRKAYYKNPTEDAVIMKRKF